MFAGFSSLCSLVGAFAFGFACRRDPFWRPLSPFSAAGGIAILVTGVPAAVSAATRSRLMGLFEPAEDTADRVQRWLRAYPTAR